MPEDLFEKLERIKIILILRATGKEKESDYAEYAELRKELVNSDPFLRDKLPIFVRSCRTLNEFWAFIQPKFPSYVERREYLAQQFIPSIEFLESRTLQSPVNLLATPILTTVDSIHVKDTWNKAVERLTHDPEGSITIARTLLEAVCKYILDEASQTYDHDTDLPDLYKKVAQQLNLSPSQHEEQIFRQILGGVSSIVTGLGSLRNKLGDAHGKGKVSMKPGPRHAQLAVNLAGSVATFLVETWEARSKNF